MFSTSHSRSDFAQGSLCQQKKPFRWVWICPINQARKGRRPWEAPPMCQPVCYSSKSSWEGRVSPRGAEAARDSEKFNKKQFGACLLNPGCISPVSAETQTGTSVHTRVHVCKYMRMCTRVLLCHLSSISTCDMSLKELTHSVIETDNSETCRAGWQAGSSGQP